MSDPISATILVVEDDANMRSLLQEELERQDYRVITASGIEPADRVLKETGIDLVVSDLRLPDGTGIDLLQHVREREAERRTGFILITGFGSIEEAVDALKKDADDFLTKPLDLEHLCLSVSRVLEHIQLRRRLNGYEALHGRESFHGMLGHSAAMQHLYRAIERVAATDGPVLIRGESGTGKELVAHALHACSSRRQGPFIPVNCAGVPADLLESEFFGHIRGAFTGATEARRGLLQAANGGTLFLDEIGEMSTSLQAKLLRVLEDGSLRPVGADQETHVDVRIIAATHRDLEQDVEAGRFREDLFYRIEAFAIAVPPLRDRDNDIDALAVRFLNAAAHRQGIHPPTLTPAAIDALHRHDWPGNVRELANTMERALAFCTNAQIDVTDLPTRITASRSTALLATSSVEAEQPLPSLEAVETAHIHRVLDAVGGNRRRAADILGIGRRTLYRKMQQRPD